MSSFRGFIISRFRLDKAFQLLEFLGSDRLANTLSENENLVNYFTVFVPCKIVAEVTWYPLFENVYLKNLIWEKTFKINFPSLIQFHKMVI